MEIKKGKMEFLVRHERVAEKIKEEEEEKRKEKIEKEVEVWDGLVLFV